ncbi:hypothetical protein [Methylobacterium sp. SyP6R]|uniref:hypothetical protein n=1 Tax=Methylobacterium sp. SyP6R TaxID=2718876 RepID=UPI001F2BEAE0|nr:hypothetical protein [Methylobacterium sp. SyP6R]MCF4125215.1 hypothetical protein [Methylobacterium sp. SyP6R]
MRDGDHGALAPAAITGGARRGPALAPVRAACRLCGFTVRGFLNGGACVLQVDGRALQSSCRAAACGGEHACAGLREAVRAARRP